MEPNRVQWNLGNKHELEDFRLYFPLNTQLHLIAEMLKIYLKKYHIPAITIFLHN